MKISHLGGSRWLLFESNQDRRCKEGCSQRRNRSMMSHGGWIAVVALRAASSISACASAVPAAEAETPAAEESDVSTEAEMDG